MVVRNGPGVEAGQSNQSDEKVAIHHDSADIPPFTS